MPSLWLAGLPVFARFSSFAPIATDGTPPWSRALPMSHFVFVTRALSSLSTPFRYLQWKALDIMENATQDSEPTSSTKTSTLVETIRRFRAPHLRWGHVDAFSFRIFIYTSFWLFYLTYTFKCYCKSNEEACLLCRWNSSSSGLTTLHNRLLLFVINPDGLNNWNNETNSFFSFSYS